MVESILIGLTTWSVTSVVVGLGLGALMKHCGQQDDMLGMPTHVDLKKTA